MILELKILTKNMKVYMYTCAKFQEHSERGVEDTSLSFFCFCLCFLVHKRLNFENSLKINTRGTRSVLRTPRVRKLCARKRVPRTNGRRIRFVSQAHEAVSEQALRRELVLRLKREKERQNFISSLFLRTNTPTRISESIRRKKNKSNTHRTNGEIYPQRHYN